MTFDTQNKCSMTARMFAAGFQRKLFGFTAPCFNVYVTELDPSYI
jgi:hypothetical protein